MIYNKKFLKGTAKGQNDVFAIFIKVGIVGICSLVFWRPRVQLRWGADGKYFIWRKRCTKSKEAHFVLIKCSTDIKKFIRFSGM